MINRLIIFILLVYEGVAGKYVYVSTNGNPTSTGLTLVDTTTWMHAHQTGNANRVAGGDTVLLIGSPLDTSFTVAAPCSCRYAAPPTKYAPVVYVGANTNGNILSDTNTLVHFTTAQNIGSLIFYQNSADSARYLIFKNIDFNAASHASYCILSSTSADCYPINAYCCNFRNAIIDNIKIRTGSGGNLFFTNLSRCKITGAGALGINITPNTRGSINLEYCIISDNHSHGALIGIGNGGQLIVRNCIFERNTTDGFRWESTGGSLIIENNISLKNGSDGFDIDDSVQVETCLNNVATWNAGYGFNFNGGSKKLIYLMKNNCAFGNGINAIDINSGVLLGTGNVTTDPLFKDTANVVRDYNPQSISPLLNSSYNIRGYK